MQPWQMPLISHITFWKACPISSFLKSEPSAVVGQESFPSCLPSIKDVLSGGRCDGSLISPKLERIQKCQY